MSESRFDRTADRYVEAAQKKDWTAFIELCRPQPDDRALDVAAGPALLSAQLVPLVARAVALEPSRPLLEHAPEGVEPVLGEAEQMPFQDSSFDLVTIVNSLHHVADMQAALAEMVRVVTPGGRIVVQDYLADEDQERAEVWERVERLRDPDHRRLPRPVRSPSCSPSTDSGKTRRSPGRPPGRSTTGWRWRSRRTRRRRRSAGWWRRTGSS